MKKIIYTFLIGALFLSTIIKTNSALAQTAYIANSDDNTVSVIDIATNLVTATIAVGSSPFGVSVSPDGNKVYVANNNSNTVSVINTANNTVTATIAVGNQPIGISVSPDGNKIYVANWGTNSNSVNVINTTTNSVTATIAVGSFPTGICVSPDGFSVYVANYGSNTVSIINTTTNLITATIAVGNYPAGVSVSPDGSKVFVANCFSNSVSVINTATNTVAASIAVGINPFGISISPDGSIVYVSHYNINSVSVINTATNTVDANIAVGNNPYGISVSPDGSKVYVANKYSDMVSVINAATNTVTDSIIVGSGPISFGNFISSCSMPAAIAGTTQTICLGGSTVIGATAIAGHNYSWTMSPMGTIPAGANPTVSPTVTTIYTLTETITLTGCQASNQVTVTVSASSISAQPINQSLTISNNAQFSVSSLDPAATYQWQTDLGVGFQNLNSGGQYSGTTNDTLAVTNVLLSNDNQLFRCLVTSGSCTDTSAVAVLTVVNNTGINEVFQSNLFTVYPNPANSQINVNADAKLFGSVYTIYDNTGKLVLSGKINSANTVIVLGDLSAGIYMFSVGENLKETFKVIKE